MNRRRVLLSLLASIPVASLGRLSMAGVADTSRPLTLGIFPRRNARITSTLFTPLVGYLEQALGREVQLISARDFSSFWRGVEQRRYDIVHFNQFHYLRARLHYGYQVVAKNEEFGSDVIAGALYVHNDSPLQSVADLRGHKVVFGGDQSAMMSYIVPTYLLQQAGLKPGDYEEAFAVSPPNAVFAAYYRQTDAAGAGDVVARLPMVTNSINVEKLRFLSISEPLPQLPWAVRDDLPVALKEEIRQLLLGLSDHEQGRKVLASAKLSALRPVQDAEYNPVETIVRRVLGDIAFD